MDKLKSKARTARNRVAEATSSGTGTGSLSVPHSTLPPEDDASIAAVHEGFIGPQPGTAARDFAVPTSQPVPQPAIEPPTSLQSSVDAGTPVPVPTRPKRGSPGTPSRSPKNGSPSGPSGSGPATSPSSIPQRRRSNSAPNRPVIGMRQASIGIRRIPSSNALRDAALNPKPSVNRLNQPTPALPAVDEDCQLDHIPTNSTDSSVAQAGPSRLRKVSSAIQTRIPFWGNKEKTPESEDGPAAARAPATSPGPVEAPREYTSDMVDVLDTLDPEVQTLTSLTNVQNSLFIPNLGRFVNRRPTYQLRRAPSEVQSQEDINRILTPALAAQQEIAPTPPPLQRSPTDGTVATMATLATIDSRLSDSRYAVLPHDRSLDGWTKQDKAEVNDHVRHMLHSKRSKFKRSMRGFGQYVRRPLGFAVTLYAFLITVFGLAWVLFLIGWVNVGGKQIYVIHIIDSVLVALFAIVGDGLAPFRAVDTYHMIYMAHYHHYTWSRRKKDRLPELHDHNDLPVGNAPISGPRETDPDDPEKQWEFTVLTPKQQAKLEHHQAKFCKSHSFYKPHETETHYAFPLRLLVAIVVLLDCHSLLQISLGATTWGIYYKHRHPAITTVILICSITCNATAGLLIMIGDRRTRKKDVLERMNRQELTEEAIQKVEKKKEKENESEREEDGEKRESRRSLNILRKRESESERDEGEKEGRRSLNLMRKTHSSKNGKQKETSAYP